MILSAKGLTPLRRGAKGTSIVSPCSYVPLLIGMATKASTVGGARLYREPFGEVKNEGYKIAFCSEKKKN